MGIRLGIFVWALHAGKFLSESFPWSTLTTIGQSPLVRATILVPFIGYLLLFNSHVQELLQISMQHVRDVTGTASNGIVQAEMTTSRLNYAYFGLVLVGLASTLFAMSAPEEIKQHPLPVDYISYMERIATPNLTRGSLQTVLSAFMRMDTAEKKSPKSWHLSKTLPVTLSNHLDRFINDIFASTLNADEEPHPDVISGAGYVRTDRIIEKMWAGRRMEWAFTEPLFKAAIPRGKDVFLLEHMTLNSSKFWLRMIIATFYGMGFALLFVPTLQTTWRLARNWFGI